MTANIKVAQSRFALLKVEDDDDDEGETKPSQGGKNNQQQSKNKNKKRKKKTTPDDELKNMAFGLSGSGNHRPQSAQSTTDNVKGNKGGKKNKEAKPEQWEEWKKVDDQLTAGFYEKDLQQALLLSKMEYEHSKSVNKKSDSKAAGKSNDQPPEGKDGKKKNKKDKPVTMSLDEFNSGSQAKSYADELEDLPSLSPASHKLESPEDAPTNVKFFDTVDDDVHKILQKEKIQEEYQKQYAVESVMSNKYKNELSKKDKEIEFLRATVGKLENELKQVKKRNKQLCVILAQGEMKDKAEVLMQVNQLGEVRDELTEQVTSLTAELEKERSKVHALKADIDKQKGGKHVGK
ncbi:G kinase-anchoring protein 1-like [Ylistrum balloti]|uniref:G kinase-anchoring protein 1-like n=1 Tax=Ylistrum balloti TaxID=509963 RepID=UPI002905F181|nr:G kinase-anchoring protein 1-like [Ylistrum balloti]